MEDSSEDFSWGFVEIPGRTQDRSALRPLILVPGPLTYGPPPSNLHLNIFKTPSKYALDPPCRLYQGESGGSGQFEGVRKVSRWRFEGGTVSQGRSVGEGAIAPRGGLPTNWAEIDDAPRLPGETHCHKAHLLILGASRILPPRPSSIPHKLSAY